ncbi:kyphoscoliosis peptidase isoform X1 [Silurus asotus]|uniref:Kyphoscoliosis peptidase isoform X1 n=1 Tax=Silurus asotus TaxID=30991 RepID=A0AAD5A065_SILAS|nr:kyphoscoliosis peptidase isoform X1 [Silurus asotus]
MTDVMVQKFPFSCSPCLSEADEQPIAEQRSHQSINQLEQGTLKAAKDPNNNPNQTNSKLEYEDKVSASKVREAQAPSTDSDLQNIDMVYSENGSTHSEPSASPNSPIKSSPTFDKQDRDLSSVENSRSKCQVSYKTVFEKWANLQYEEQRPSTKRQLSAESAAKSVTVRKRTTVASSKEEPAKSLTHTNPGTQLRKAGLPIRLSCQRQPRRQLFTSTGVFHKMDTHVISKGKELKEQAVFSPQSIARIITQGAKNELEKIRAIWVWLCHNIEYDLDGYLGLSPKLCTPEEVIKKGKGVCSGFSSICLEMCREVGIQCEEVSGYSKGIGHWPGRRLADKPSDHMWNAVWVKGQWGLLDACWGAGTVNMDTKTFIKRFDDFYFLTEPRDFINSHFPDEENWQLLDNPISLEQFALIPLKTSAFYTLGLTLQQPTQYKIITDDGKTTVSVSSCRRLTFAYELRQRDTETGAARQNELDGSCGLLSVTQQGMSLRLLPPEPGAYELKLFARPDGDSGTLLWVCTLELECPAVQQSQSVPPNPYLSWGLGSNAGAHGVKACSVPSQDALEVCETGECEVVLHTSRPLMMVCELVHSELDFALAKRCLALQIAAERLVCNVLCPYKGYYRLSVFVRDYDDGSGSFQNVGNFLLRCRGLGVNQNMLYPSDLSPWCGPGMRTQAVGLSHFSHTGALVNLPQGRCNITFHCSTSQLQIHAVLSAESCQKNKEKSNQAGFPLSRHILLTFTDSKVTVSVCVPQPGVYRLGLYGRTPPQQDYAPLCDYVLRSTCDRCGEPFPCVYSAWGKGCVLLEPRGGVLAPQSWVCFRVRVSSACRVSVLAEQRVDLKMNKSRVWEGKAFTGDIAQIKLTAATSDTGDMAVLMTFDVLNLESRL